MSLARVSRAWLIAALTALSCGGEEFTSGSGGAGGSGTGGTSSGGGDPVGGSSGALPGACPTTVPSAGSPCDDSDRLCTYGVDARPKCRRQMLCDGSGWRTHFEPVGSECGPATCASTVKTGASCDTKGDECTTSQGYCACLCLPGCSGYRWTCSTPSGGCPAIVPNAGTGCAPDGSSCRYGACDQDTGVSDQVRVECKNGLWEWTETSCLTP